MKKYNVVLLEKPLENGISAKELYDISSILSKQKSEEWFPLEIVGNNSAAIGFIDIDTAEKIGYVYNDLKIFIVNILNDMNNENQDGQYEFNNINILLKRDFECEIFSMY